MWHEGTEVFSDLVPGLYWNTYSKQIVIIRQSKEYLFCGEATLRGYFLDDNEIPISSI